MRIEQLETTFFEDFIALAKVMQEECEPDLLFDEQTLVEWMFNGTADAERKWMNAWLAYDDEDKLIGMAVASTGGYPFSKSTWSLMHYWYVLPEYRQTFAALELLQAFEAWSRKLGCIRMHFGADRVDVDKARDINGGIEKLGFTKYGEQFYKRLD